METADRFFAKVEPQSNGCWRWTGAMHPDGYGQFFNGRKSAAGHPIPGKAHRVAYELFVGEIPTGYDVDHLCHGQDRNCPPGTDCPHRRCVNPTHLEPTVRRENLRRGHGFVGARIAQTHCIHGHPFDEANTRYRAGRGGRQCRACDAITHRARREAA